jgi:hypothetical protein
MKVHKTHDNIILVGKPVSRQKRVRKRVSRTFCSRAINAGIDAKKVLSLKNLWTGLKETL